MSMEPATPQANGHGPVPAAPAGEPEGFWVTLPNGERFFARRPPPGTVLPKVARPADAPVGTVSPEAPAGTIAPAAPVAEAAAPSGAAAPAHMGESVGVPERAAEVTSPVPSPVAGTAGYTEAVRAEAVRADAVWSGPSAAPPRDAEDAAGAPFTPVPAEAVELADDGLQEMVEVVPGALVRWGISVVAVAVVALLAVSAWVRFPVVVAGTATVTSSAPPVRLATGGGELQRLLVRDGEEVRAGQVLAVMRGAADYRAVLALDTLLRGRAPGALPAVALPPGMDRAALGDLLASVSRYEAARADYHAYAGDPLLPARVDALRTQAAQQQALVAGTSSRADLLARDVELAQHEAERSRELVRRELISAEEGEKAESSLLARRQALADARNNLISQQIRLSELRQELLQAQQQGGEDARQRMSEGEKALAAVVEAVAEWESRNLVQAPADGRVTFFRRLTAGQYVAPGDAVLAVVPASGGPVAAVRIGNDGVGRVRRGQRVVFRFDAFPSQEFGTVEGVVRRTSLVANEPAAAKDGAPEYLVTVDFPHGLRTSRGTQLPLRQEMSGTAEIVTSDRSILKRLFFRLGDSAAPGGGAQ